MRVAQVQLAQALALKAIGAQTRRVQTGPFVVMGVAGSGKSLIGASFAEAIGGTFLDGDDFHPPRNVRLMADGIPLTDADRAGWLAVLADKLRDATMDHTRLVLACSALKRRYRDVLRAGAADTQFVFLRGTRDVIAERLALRRGHYMPASLLDSQFAALEEPDADERVWVCDVTATPRQIVDDLVKRTRA